MPHASTGTAAPGGLRVLVVDDCQEMRERVRRALERAGLTVVGEAGDGAEALVQVAARRPDVVLMDLHMPRMDGVQATRALRRQQPQTRVVLWSGESDEHLASALRHSGADAGLLKGVGTADLVAALREAHHRADLGPAPAAPRRPAS